MDIVTHGVIGAVAARGGFSQRLGRPATVALVAGALLPDVDVVTGFFDQMAAIKYHRGLTHSFIGAIPLAFVAAAFFWKWRNAGSYWILAGLIYLGVVLHILSDLATSYGTMLFFPLSAKRYALDWVFILDPVYTAILLAGLILGWRQPDRSGRYARASLIALVVYVAMAGVGQQVALGRFRDDLATHGIRPSQIGIFPELPGVLRWRGVAEEGVTLYESRRALWDRSRSRLESYRNEVSDGELARVAALDEVQAYLRFARFPWVTVNTSNPGRVLEIRDLRFGSYGRRESFLLRVTVDQVGGQPEVSFNHRF
jgi:inner membrane protein